MPPTNQIQEQREHSSLSSRQHCVQIFSTINLTYISLSLSLCL